MTSDWISSTGCGSATISPKTTRSSSPSKRSTALAPRHANGLRAVLDPNVLVAALLSARGTPARVFRAWLDGVFELVVSPALLAELERALGYPKLRRRIPAEEAEELIELLRRTATFVNDPPGDSAALTSSDPGDDYLLALAMHTRSVLVSGDNDLLTIDTDLPIHPPAAFMAFLERD